MWDGAMLVLGASSLSLRKVPNLSAMGCGLIGPGLSPRLETSRRHRGVSGIVQGWERLYLLLSALHPLFIIPSCVNGRVATRQGLLPAKEDEMKPFRKAAFLSFGLAFLSCGAALAQAPVGFTGQILTCERMRKHTREVFSGNICLKSGVYRSIWVGDCEESLDHRPFLRRLTSLTETIHGPFWHRRQSSHQDRRGASIPFGMRVPVGSARLQARERRVPAIARVATPSRDALSNLLRFFIPASYAVRL
jgi:hypothetical protein